jgi:hypothetical protein
VANRIACTIETLINGRNTRPGLDLSGIPHRLLPFIVALLHKAGAYTAYALPLYKKQPPLGTWLTTSQYLYVLSNYTHLGLCFTFQPSYWDTGVEAVPDAYPLLPPGWLAKALLHISAASLLKHCCLAGMADLAAAAEQLGLVPAGTAAAAAKEAVSASSGMGMLRRIWCNQLLRLRPHVLLNLLTEAQPLQLQPAAVPMLVAHECDELALSSR